jgi:hypothetical protein
VLSRGARRRVREPGPALTAPELASAAAFGAWLASCDEDWDEEPDPGEGEPDEYDDSDAEDLDEPEIDAGDFDPCDS